MSRLELSDIEKETQERAEGTDEMQSEVEKHQERAEKLVADLDEVRSVLAEVGSDKLREAESRLEQAREDTKKQLEKLKDRRDRMIEENQKMEQKLVEQNEKRRSASEKMARMKMMFEGASSEFKDEINRASDALTKDLEHFSEAQESLRAVHQKLDEMNFEMKTN
jgi:chromosome segregation ATPase